MQLLDLIRKAKRVYIIGNGGSFANSQHIANDLLSRGIRTYTIDPATFSAFSNDYGYEFAFARWIGTVGERGDLLLALSGSGKSPNILRAVDTAKDMGMDVWTEFGYPQGLDMQSAEERQIVLGHDLMRGLS